MKSIIDNVVNQASDVCDTFSRNEDHIESFMVKTNKLFSKKDSRSSKNSKDPNIDLDIIYPKIDQNYR